MRRLQVLNEKGLSVGMIRPSSLSQRPQNGLESMVAAQSVNFEHGENHTSKHSNGGMLWALQRSMSCVFRGLRIRGGAERNRRS
jgi:hypothetical protein